MSNMNIRPLLPKEAVSSILSLRVLFTPKENSATVGFVLKMHAATCLILLTGAFFLTLTQYFGDPITCLYRGNNQFLSQILIERFCWMEGTYSVASSNTYIGRNAAYYGVTTESGTRISHRYYHWVYYVLVLQCFAFYAPSSLWNATEADALSKIIADVRKYYSADASEAARSKTLRNVRDAMYRGSRSFRTLVFCECLCLVNLIMQVWCTDAFLGGRFSSLGRVWLERSKGDPLVEIFPRIAKCGFHFYGQSGSLENVDVLCFLPLNTVIEKTYLTLWFWFAALSVAISFSVLCRALAFYVCIRAIMLKTYAPISNRQFANKICENIGYWFIFLHIAKHTNASTTACLLDDIYTFYFSADGKILFRQKEKPKLSEPANPEPKTSIQSLQQKA